MVYFVGAGPGAADLITVRGMRLLQKADVIIYAGSLVNPALLDYAKETCQTYNSATMTLEEVFTVMQEAEKEGKMTVCILENRAFTVRCASRWICWMKRILHMRAVRG